MCTQFNFLFKCGHRGFDKFENCANFGRSCYGAGGKHKDKIVPDICNDCKARARLDQGGGDTEKPKDPWWDDDPWRKRRKG